MDCCHEVSANWLFYGTKTRNSLTLNISPVCVSTRSRVCMRLKESWRPRFFRTLFGAHAYDGIRQLCCETKLFSGKPFLMSCVQLASERYSTVVTSAMQPSMSHIFAWL